MTFNFSFFAKIKKIIKITAVIILFVTIIAFWTELIYSNFGNELGLEKNCNVSNIELNGELVSYISNDAISENGIALIDAVSSEDIVATIENADNDQNIKAIVLEINSFGGSPVAGEEIANSLKRASKPTVAWIREAGTSVAYWSATGADMIFASVVSDIGSIGVTISYLDNIKKNEKDGLAFNQLSSGKFKDMLNSDKPLTEEERKLIERDLKILHENFIKAVSENRKMDIEKVRKLADGSSMLGQMALENGLIDKIGGINEVKEYLKQKIGEEIRICE